ncbi:MAG: hypothetical protein EAX81_02320 [Candidatus Thorarchaeota archaeon]|nr:hypothetical protein [Candidatus Thorarchaeota archaeon]
MMMAVRRIEARAHVRATEVPDRVLAAVTNVFPEIYHDQLETTWTKVETHSGILMFVVIAVLEGEKACINAFESIMNTLSMPDKRTLSRTIESRIDDQCIFYLRLEKQEAFLERLKLAIGPDVISLRVHLQQLPRCKYDDAAKFIIDRLENAGGHN